MDVMLDNGAFFPKRAYETDAGLDLQSRETKIVPAHGSAIFKTGIHIRLPKNTAGLLISKSGLNVKYDITSTGLIDEGYTGEITVKLHNHGNSDYIVNRGDKISQLIVIPVFHEEIDIVNAFPETDRGDNGFGSSGK